MQFHQKAAALLKDFSIILLGSAISTLGSRMAFNTGLGVAPIYMVDEGFSLIFHVSLGSAIWITCAVLLLVGILLDRHAIGLVTVVTSLFTGVLIDLWNLILPAPPQEWVGRLLFMFAGLVLSNLGAAIYLRTNCGGSCVEIIMLCICRKTGISIGPARIVSDALWFICGFFMGGTWGVGTLVNLLLNGPVLQFWMKLLDKRLLASTAA